MNPKVLPTVLMIIDFGAAMPYFFSGDWKRGVYWIAAGVLTWERDMVKPYYQDSHCTIYHGDRQAEKHYN